MPFCNYQSLYQNAKSLHCFINLSPFPCVYLSMSMFILPQRIYNKTDEKTVIKIPLLPVSWHVPIRTVSNWIITFRTIIFSSFRSIKNIKMSTVGLQFPWPHSDRNECRVNSLLKYKEMVLKCNRTYRKFTDKPIIDKECLILNQCLRCVLHYRCKTTRLRHRSIVLSLARLAWTKYFILL